MDKQFAFFTIAMLAICVGFVTWAAISSPKRSLGAKVFAYAYTTLMWVCIIIMTICTILYK